MSAQKLEQPNIAARIDLVALLNEVIASARFHEENLQRDLKFRRADLDVVKSEHGLAVGAGAEAEQLAKLQAQIDAVTADVNNLAGQYEAANVHRKRLDAILKGVNAGVDAAAKSRDQYQSDVDRLQQSLAEAQANLRKAIVRAPVLDAFDTSNREIKQIWLPKLTINYNFSNVARFDRCVTCHLGIDKTAPGSPSEPGYEAAHVVEGLALLTPNSSPVEDLQNAAGELPGDQVDAALLQTYGLHLSREGLFDPNEVMIETVLSETPAAMARLVRGDVILFINDVKITDRGVAIRYLLERVEWGKPLTLTVRRGVPHPYASHPRLGLYGGSMSPHPFTKIGCTICHDGQGSATSFKWASHTPNSMKQTEEWAHKYGWFNNHHWIFPMPAKRFNESLCLKCHHQVTELRPSERFPDPPAPNLMAGYDTIRTFGCFGCHEINGYNGPNQTIGPDLRTEPNYSGVAAALAVDPGLDEQGVKHRLENLFGAEVEIKDGAPAEESLRQFYDQLQAAARPLVDHPSDTAARHKLMALLETDFGRRREGGQSYLGDRLLKLRSVLADTETPGLLRKVGPSLRHVGSKLDRQFVYNQVREPKNFRPSSRMPQFFGQYAHLIASQHLQNGHKAASQSDNGPASAHVSEPEKTMRYEHVEVSAITEYLLAASQPFVYIEPDKRVTEKPSAERGKFLFQTRGCLACHTHAGFPEMKETQGPNLTGLGSKLTSPQAKRWLYSWLRNPTHYNARTRMPNLFLEPLDVPPPPPVAEEGKPAEVAKPAESTGPAKVTDPAADLIEFLLSSPKAWTPRSAKFGDDQTLKELALEHLSGAFTRRQAERYVESGIPASMASELKGDEIELVGEINSPEQRRETLLRYVGRKSIAKYGCFGCHDIPGFEDAKPIGTGLADWGRKEPSKLAFEQVTQYLHLQQHHAESENGEAAVRQDPTRAYFINAINAHMREGFIWEKLHEPRSFDFEKTANKGYNERLRMPKFPFDEAQIEEVMTFVLGLVAEPPRASFSTSPPRGARPSLTVSACSSSTTALAAIR